MAQKTIIELIDDLDGGEATQTITFGLNGQTYEIDLNDEHAEGLHKALEKYVSVARKVGAGPGPKKPTYAKTDVVLTAVRAWAAANGIDVAARGRVAADVIEKFRAAGN